MKKVLLVDDHTDIRRLIRITLGKNFDVMEAGDGAKGLELARDHRPDLMVLDVMMPGEPDGLQVLDAIRADPQLEHIRIFMVTARGQQHDLDDARQRGADAYFVKPFRPMQLVEAIKETLVE